MNKQKSIQFILTIAVILFSTYSALAQSKLEDWSLQYQEQTISSQNLNNKVVVFVFWASWCPPCLSEIPTLKSLQQEFGSQGLQVIGLSLDKNQQAHDKLVAEQNLNYPSFPVASSSGGIKTMAKIQKAINTQINSIPTLVIRNRNGTVVNYRVGLTSHATLKAEIQSLLK